MAQFTFTSSEYGGTVLDQYMAATLLEADSVKRGLLTVIPDVKFQKTILDVDDVVKLQDPSAIFVDQGTTTTQNETTLIPIPYEFMKQEDWTKLCQTWEAEKLKPGALQDYEGIVDLSDFVASRYKVKLNIANERLYWLGKGATKEAVFTAAYLGLLPLIKASGSSYKISITGAGKATYMAATAIANTGIVTVADTTALADGDVVTIKMTAGGTLNETTVGGTNNAVMLNNVQSYFITVIDGATFKLNRNYNDINTRLPATFAGTAATAADVSFINAGNVLKVLGSVYAQIDPADRKQLDFNIQISNEIGYAYAQAQANKAVNVINAFTDVKKMDYLGIPLQLMDHWAANTILAARSGNLFMGTDLASDSNEFSTVYMKPFTNDNVVRTKARMRSDVKVKFLNETLLVSPN